MAERCWLGLAGLAGVAALMVGAPSASAQTALYGETAHEQILKTPQACILSQFTLAARLTIHAVDPSGEVMLAFDLVDPPRPGQPDQDSRTIRLVANDGSERLYGRLGFRSAATADGGSRISAILPREFLSFLGTSAGTRLSVIQDNGNEVGVPNRETRPAALRILQDCTENL